MQEITWEFVRLSRLGQTRKLFVASELKALEGVCNKIETFYQDILFTAKTDKITTMVQKRDWEDLIENVKDNETSIAAIRKGLEEAVHRQMMSDVPYGVLLSGGLDSSIIS